MKHSIFAGSLFSQDGEQRERVHAETHWVDCAARYKTSTTICRGLALPSALHRAATEAPTLQHRYACGEPRAFPPSPVTPATVGARARSLWEPVPREMSRIEPQVQPRRAQLCPVVFIYDSQRCARRVSHMCVQPKTHVPPTQLNGCLSPCCRRQTAPAVMKTRFYDSRGGARTRVSSDRAASAARSLDARTRTPSHLGAPEAIRLRSAPTAR